MQSNNQKFKQALKEPIMKEIRWCLLQVYEAYDFTMHKSLNISIQKILEVYSNNQWYDYLITNKM